MLSKIVRELREAAGWTQEKLAKEAGVSQQLIAKIENGKVVESRKLPGIANAFGLTIDQLLRTSDTKAANSAKKSVATGQWPFRFARARWDQLPLPQRKEIEGVVERMLRAYEAGNLPTETKSRAAKKAG